MASRGSVRDFVAFARDRHGAFGFRERLFVFGCLGEVVSIFGLFHQHYYACFRPAGEKQKHGYQRI